jgi:hypothetical protein
MSVLRTLLFYTGFLLIIFLFSEEAQRLLNRLAGLLNQSPHLKILIYPLVALLFLAALGLMVSSVISFVTSLKFSYD